jgi:uncharacterized protein YjdB
VVGVTSRKWLTRWSRRVVRPAVLSGVALALAACLNDTPTGGGARLVRASLNANIAGSLASGTVSIRIGYRTSQEAFVPLPSSPEAINIGAGTTVEVPVTVDISACLADENRVQASRPGCVLTVELSLSDATGAPIDTRTIEAPQPATPGQAIDFGTVTIGITVSTVVVAPASLGLNVGEQQQLTTTVRDASGAVTTVAQVAWSTSDGTVVQLTTGQNGTVTVRALKVGTATVTASAGGKSSTPVPVTVTPPAPLVVTQRQGAGCVVVGQTINLDVTSPPGTITWSSASPGVATVSSTGLVTGVGPGSTVITATSGARTGDATVCVNARMTIANTQVALVAGQTTQITPVNVQGGVLSFASSAPTVATVDQTGVVRTVGVGQTTVTVTFTAPSGTQSIPVQVTVSAAGLTISPTSATASVNGVARLTAIPLDVNGKSLASVPVTWSISDPTVGSLSATSGPTVDVRALKVGTTVVRATLGVNNGNAQFTATPALPAARLEKVSGDGAVCPTRSTTCTFVARAVDINGVPVPNALVTWSSNFVCGAPRQIATDATGLSTATNICSTATAGAYTQTAALPSVQQQVSFAYSLRGLVLSLQDIDSYGNYIYSVSSPATPANGLSVAIEYTSGPVKDYVTDVRLTSTSTPTTLTIGLGGLDLPISDYTLNVVVSTTTPGIGPGVDAVSFTVDSAYGFIALPNANRRRPPPVRPLRAP